MHFYKAPTDKNPAETFLCNRAMLTTTDSGEHAWRMEKDGKTAIELLAGSRKEKDDWFDLLLA